MRHAHSVRLVQNIVRQVITLVHQQVAVHDAIPQIHWQHLDQPPKAGSIEPWADSFPLFDREGSVPKEMRLVGMKAAPLDPALQFVLKADLLIRYWQTSVCRGEEQPPREGRHQT